MEENKMTTYAGYREYKEALDTELAKTAEGFVRIGYLLRVAADTDILRDSGYKNVLEFAKKEYGLDKSQVSRFMAINERFSENGYSDRLNVNYQGFGYAKLSIMLQLPEAVNKILTPEFTKSDIQKVKEEVDKEKEISDLELLTEDVVVDMDSMTIMEKVMYQTGREMPELFLNLYQAEDTDAATLQEIFAPAGEGLITVRIPGTGRLMLSVKGVDQMVSLVNVRSGEKETFTWERVIDAIGKLTGRTLDNRPEDGKVWWEKVYKEPWPIEEKEEVAPVQPKRESQKPRKESKVVPAKPKPPKKPKKEEPKTVMEEPKSVTETPEIVPKTPEVAPVQPDVEGQTSFEKDFPEYLPDDYVVADGGVEVLPAEKEKKQGPCYEIKKGELGFELYDDSCLLIVCKSAGNAMLIRAILEKESEKELDYEFTKEDCEKFFKESEDIDDRTDVPETGPEEET